MYIRASVCMTIYYTLWNSDSIVLDYVKNTLIDASHDHAIPDASQFTGFCISRSQILKTPEKMIPVAHTCQCVFRPLKLGSIGSRLG
jgi:hypothetical protein